MRGQGENWSIKTPAMSAGTIGRAPQIGGVEPTTSRGAPTPVQIGDAGAKGSNVGVKDVEHARDGKESRDDLGIVSGADVWSSGCSGVWNQKAQEQQGQE